MIACPTPKVEMTFDVPLFVLECLNNRGRNWPNSIISDSFGTNCVLPINVRLSDIPQIRELKVLGQGIDFCLPREMACHFFGGCDPGIFPMKYETNGFDFFGSRVPKCDAVYWSQEYKGSLYGNQRLTTNNSRFAHFSQLATHCVPLEEADEDRDESEEGNRSCEPSHNLFGPSHPAFKIGYAVFILLLAYLCCVRANWVIFRQWDGNALLWGLLLYGLAGLLIWHVFIVTQKYFLTTHNYCNTVIAIERAQMANALSTEKQAAIIGALAEGSSIRSIERQTGVHRDTIMRLGVRVGKGCAALLDAKMRDLSLGHVQFDEIWGFIGKKEKHVQPNDNPTLGDVWTFCALDSETKLVPAFKVGKRTRETTRAFVQDVASRLRNRVQLSTDAMSAYVEAVELAFGPDVDYAQVVKVYESEAADARVIRMDKTSCAGRPDMHVASTSHVERLNGTTRLHMRRLTRLTYAFSKKLENFEAAVALHFAYYNFVKRHNSIRCTPAMAAGVERNFWTVRDLVEAA